MIRTFKCTETEKLWQTGFSKKFPLDIQKRALIKLAMLNRSKELDDLRIPPSNNLESLKGNRAGQYSIRINTKYRLCFVLKDQDAFEVEIIDYH